MGSGKSSVGRVLSSLLSRRFIDLDEHILETSGAPSINSLFSYLGESGFRKIEQQSLLEILKLDNQVIASGGGTLVSEFGGDLNRNLNVTDSTIVYLETDFEICKSRASKNNRRPLFKDSEKAEALFIQRKPLYERLATITVKSDGSSAKVVANNILKKLYPDTF